MWANIIIYSRESGENWYSETIAYCNNCKKGQANHEEKCQILTSQGHPSSFAASLSTKNRIGTTIHETNPPHWMTVRLVEDRPPYIEQIIYNPCKAMGDLYKGQIMNFLHRGSNSLSIWLCTQVLPISWIYTIKNYFHYFQGRSRKVLVESGRSDKLCFVHNGTLMECIPCCGYSSCSCIFIDRALLSFYFCRRDCTSLNQADLWLAIFFILTCNQIHR